MNIRTDITVGPYTFTQASYDADRDLLALSTNDLPRFQRDYVADRDVWLWNLANDSEVTGLLIVDAAKRRANGLEIQIPGTGELVRSPTVEALIS